MQQPYLWHTFVQMLIDHNFIHEAQNGQYFWLVSHTYIYVNIHIINKAMCLCALQSQTKLIGFAANMNKI